MPGQPFGQGRQEQHRLLGEAPRRVDHDQAAPGEPRRVARPLDQEIEPLVVEMVEADNTTDPKEEKIIRARKALKGRRGHKRKRHESA